MFETLLFPIDQSQATMDTAAKAIELALSQNSQMFMLHVIKANGQNINSDESMASLLNTAKEKVQQAGVPCEVIEREGKPAFVICDVADELNVDLIIMGTRGIDITEDNESTTSRVIQLAPCPVLVVP